MASDLKQRVKQKDQAQNVSSPSKTRKRPQTQQKDSGFNHWPVFAKLVGVFLFGYYCCMMATRYQFRGVYAFVDTLWVCNLNLLLASVAIFTGYRPLLGGTINSVFVPHMLWVIDATTYLFTGNFPIGLAAYIAWPTTPLAELLTSTHHVWFIPLLLLVLHKNGGVPFWGWPISLAGISPVLFVSYFFPEEIILSNGEPYYLNVNMAHGWWRDMNGYPWDLIPKTNPLYMLFLHLFTALQFTVSFLLTSLVGKILIKRQ